MHRGPVINIFLHNLCITNPLNDPKSPKKGENRDISKIAIKSRDCTARVSNFPMFLRFKYILRINQSCGRNFPRNLCAEGGKVLNYPACHIMSAAIAIAIKFKKNKIISKNCTVYISSKFNSVSLNQIKSHLMQSSS